MNKEEIEQLEQMVNQVESAIPLLRECIAKMKEIELGEDNVMNRPIIEVLQQDAYFKTHFVALSFLSSDLFKNATMTTVAEFIRTDKVEIVKRCRNIRWKTLYRIQDVLKQNGIYW